MDAGDVPELLTRHPHVRAVTLTGSRATGATHDFSDWDFVVETDDFDRVARDLPRLLEPLRPIAEQWDPYADHACYMLMLRGARKVDLLFLDQARDVAPPWRPAPETLEAIDRHFWDWIVWLEQKRTGGSEERLAALLQDMQRLMLGPMGVADTPASISDAVAAYTTARGRLEHEYGFAVPRDLEADVRPVVTARQPST
jgi:hypothetical protein